MRVVSFNKNIALLSIAVLLYFSGTFMSHLSEWNAPTIQITELERDFTLRFTSRFDVEHHILIEFDRLIRPKYWGCVYGATAFDLSQCKNGNNVATVSWSIIGEDRLIDSGVASGYGRGVLWGDGYAASEVASYKPKKGVEYSVSVSLSGPPRIVDDTRPRLVIVLPSNFHKNRQLNAEIVQLISIAVFALAIILLVYKYFIGFRHG